MSMRKLLAAFLISLPMALFAQNAIVQEGEFGFGVGAGHYFGDLNTKAKLNRPKIAAGIFFRKKFRKLYRRSAGWQLCPIRLFGCLQRT